MKTLMMLRIYSNKWHVYGGLALLNPSAKPQIRQYAKSVSELFKLIIQEREQEFKERIKSVRKHHIKHRPCDCPPTRRV